MHNVKVMNSRPMNEIVQHCPLCGSTASSLFDQREFRGVPVTNVMCLHCGLVFQTPRMDEREREAFYEAGYRTLYQGQETPKAEDLAIQEKRAKAIMDFLPGRVNPERVLDIGCSAGNLLLHFNHRYLTQVYGIEPGKMYREYALSSGLQVFASLEDLKQTAPERFNLVSLIHVLEHLPNPLHYIRELREQLLEPDSWLLVEVPNLYAHDCFEVAHLVSFSAHTLTALVREGGFRVIKLRAHGKPRSTLVPLYLTLLARADQGAVNHRPLQREPGIRLKRELGLFRRKVIERLLPQLAWH